MIYADYAFYTGTFYGDLIPEESFEKYAARASDYIDRVTMNRAQNYVVFHPDDLSVQKACCAGADQYFMISKAKAAAASDSGELASETVGNHSVSYRSGLETAASLEAELRNVVESYLAMTGLLYRGISHVYSTCSNHCQRDRG